MAWGGDFQQTLPIVPKGTKEDIIGASIQRSTLWRHVEILHLTENMRVNANDPQSTEFARWLLKVGHGVGLPIDHSLKLPQHMICGPTVSELISEIYPGIQRGEALQDKYLLERCILCPRNAEVDEINSIMVEKFTGEAQRVYSSADSVKGSDNANQYPVEYLNSINSGSLPPSQLKVKRGVPLMLLCNLDPGQGLCNGTRLHLIHMTNRVLHVRILTGPCAGNLAFIPRITVTTEKELPFALHRRQFPVRLAFGMTINKSQGQSLGTVGLDLRYSVFGHGQLYVGASRGTNWSRVKVLLPSGNKTSNIVYKEVLLDVE